MRGAVLHGLGLNMVPEHLMRRSYGSEQDVLFNPNEHPAEHKFVDKVDGCDRFKVMCWFAKKVYSILVSPLNNF
jgi:hypothetical protein